MHFLVELGELPEAANDEQLSKFRIGRFLNQTPDFSKEKKGLNISILIILIMFLVSRGKYTDPIDKIEAV